MSNRIYEASVYSREVSYRNFQGEEKKQTLYFALDPLQLMQVIATYVPQKIKSGNPARNGQDAEITGEQQLKLVRDLALQAAGFPSEDGEAFEPYKTFNDDLVGKAFLAQLAASDGDRKEFSEKVILAPFRAFVGYVTEDSTNSEADKLQFRKMLQQMENIFLIPEKQTETVEERRQRLAAELAAMDSEQPSGGPIPLPPNA